MLLPKLLHNVRKSTIFSLHKWLEGTHWCDRCNNWKVQIQTSEITDSMVLTVSGPYKVTPFTKYTTVLPLSICTYLHTQHTLLIVVNVIANIFFVFLYFVSYHTVQFTTGKILDCNTFWTIIIYQQIAVAQTCTTCYYQHKNDSIILTHFIWNNELITHSHWNMIKLI